MSKKISDLTPNPRNPRRISDFKKKLLRKALAQFGDLGGVILNVHTGQLIGGHQRCQAWADNQATVKILKSYEPPTKVGTVAEGYIEAMGERFSYREVRWPEATEQAANLAANKNAGTFDLPLLQDVLHDLDALNFDLDLTLFDSTERANLLTGAPGTAEEIDLSRVETFKVSVDCRDAQHQAEVMQQLEDLGLSPKASMT